MELVGPLEAFEAEDQELNAEGSEEDGCPSIRGEESDTPHPRTRCYCIRSEGCRQDLLCAIDVCDLTGGYVCSLLLTASDQYFVVSGGRGESDGRLFLPPHAVDGNARPRGRRGHV